MIVVCSRTAWAKPVGTRSPVNVSTLERALSRIGAGGSRQMNRLGCTLKSLPRLRACSAPIFRFPFRASLT